MTGKTANTFPGFPGAVGTLQRLTNPILEKTFKIDIFDQS